MLLGSGESERYGLALSDVLNTSLRSTGQRLGITETDKFTCCEDVSVALADTPAFLLSPPALLRKRTVYLGIQFGSPIPWL